MLKATVSGSFHRHMTAIEAAVSELWALGVNVLSPADPRIVDFLGEFLFVASDRLRSIKLVQDRHFEAIRSSDFLWVVCPDGYTGASTSAEIGAAHVLRVPSFSTHPPQDITISHYVSTVASMRDAIAMIEPTSVHRGRVEPHFLLDPDYSIDKSMRTLDHIRRVVKGKDSLTGRAANLEVRNGLNILSHSLGINRAR